MRNAISKQGRSATVAAGLAVAAALTGSAHAGVIESSPTFPPDPLSFTSPTGAGCFDVAAVCVTPGTFTLTSPMSTFVPATTLLPAVQDIAADATYTGSLTTLPTANPPSVFLGSFTLTGTVDLEVIGRTSAMETGSWTAELTGISLSGPLLSFGTLTATLDMDDPSKGTVSIAPLGQNAREFVITSFFDIFMDVTLDDRPLGMQPLMTTVGPIPVVAGTPEPATWAMVLIGFAGLAFAARRRAAAPAG